MKPFIAGCVLMMITSFVTNAHEFWIAPSDLSPSPDELVLVRLMHGERFQGDIVPRNNFQIKRYELVTHSRQAPVMGRHMNQDGYFRVEESGVIVYESEMYSSNLPAEKFESYLREEKLDTISEWRAEHNESEMEGREDYMRCAKAIVVAEGDTRGISEIDRPLGLPLEIVLESCDRVAAMGEEGSVKVVASVLYQGKPAKDLRVVAVRSTEPEALIELKSDAHGKVTLEGARPDEWMLTTIHMVRDEQHDDVDWTSYWASSVFDIQGEMNHERE
jgi:uncharacterized GH25 family protein